MIGRGTFETHLSTIEEILKEVNLFESRIPFPNNKLGAAHFKRLEYREIYDECLKEFAYNFQLSDQSLLLFVREGNDNHKGLLSYCYYECPVDVMSYDEFVENSYSLSHQHELDLESFRIEFGEELREGYEQYVREMEFKRHVTPIRYDYNALYYREGIHPASHMHFGFGNQIRVGTQKILNPISFLLIILRQRYPRAWEIVLKHPNAETWCRNFRRNISKVDKAYWGKLDNQEIALY